MDKYYLVIYSDNCADEFYVDGFKIYNEKEYKAFQKNLKKIEGIIGSTTIEYYVGTNEYIEYSKDRTLTNHFLIKSINEEEFKIFKKVCNCNNEYGTFFNLEEYLEDYEEDNEI